MSCSRCGQCCENNGLIPPLMEDEEAPEWLRFLVKSLQTRFGDVAEEYSCVFLTDDLRCAIHNIDMAKPGICEEHLCEEAADGKEA